MAIKLTINGVNRQIDLPEDTPLLWAIRDGVELTGTKFGCGIAQCGACTVHVDGRPTRSCVLPISAIAGSNITTIEGVESKAAKAVQAAWNELSVAQCGYCQSGQVMSATALLENNSSPDESEISNAMNGNICRCATYGRIKTAIKLASTKLENQGAEHG